MSDHADDIQRRAAQVAELIRGLPETTAPRHLAAIAGPPGSGKSTLAEAVVARLADAGLDAVLMPMDGFHLDNRLLEPRGLLARKGAPETFDFGGFSAALGRVRTEPGVYLPVFDRAREIAIASAAEIRPETTHVVVEGNYLLLDEDPWRALAGMWDVSVYLDVGEAELERRLVDRWRSFGFDEAAARDKAEGNDLPNARRVRAAVVDPDLTLSA